MVDKTIKQLQKLIEQYDKRIAKFIKQETTAKQRWYKLDTAYRKAAKLAANLKNIGTQKQERLRRIILDYDDKSAGLSKIRDDARRSIAEERERETRLRIEMSKLIAQAEVVDKTHNEIVDQVFFLNDGVVRALAAISEYLTSHVYHLLIDKDGKLRSQITFTHSDGTRRVRAMVNAITRVESYMAAEATGLISRFFERIQPNVQMDHTTQALYDLTKGLLVEKTQFKIGPDLYRFLGLELDNEIFPELKAAQTILRGSLRSEKTSSYVRLYRRAGRNSKWEQIKQS